MPPGGGFTPLFAGVGFPPHLVIGKVYHPFGVVLSPIFGDFIPLLAGGGLAHLNVNQETQSRKTGRRTVHSSDCFGLDCLALLCCVVSFVFCVGGIKPPWGEGGWFYPPKGVVLSPKRCGFIPQKGWFYPPKGVVLSPIKVGIKPPGVVLRVVLSPISGWFYARDQQPAEALHMLYELSILHCTRDPYFVVLGALLVDTNIHGTS